MVAPALPSGGSGSGHSLLRSAEEHGSSNVAVSGQAAARAACASLSGEGGRAHAAAEAASASAGTARRLKDGQQGGHESRAEEAKRMLEHRSSGLPSARQSASSAATSNQRGQSHLTAARGTAAQLHSEVAAGEPVSSSISDSHPWSARRTQQAALSILGQVTCDVCREPFDEPVTLPCGHSTCLRCIVQRTAAPRSCAPSPADAHIPPRLPLCSMSVPCAVEQCPRSAIGRGLGIWSEHRAMFGPDLNAGDETAASSASALGQGPGCPPMDGFVVAEPDQALSLSVIPAQAKGKTSAYAVKPFGCDDASTSSPATFLRADVTLSKAVAVLRQHAAVGVSSPVQQLSAAARRSNDRQNAASARRERESAAALSRGRRRIRRSLMSGDAPRRALNALPRRQTTVQQEDDRVPIAYQFLSMLGGSEEGRESGAVGGIHAADSDSDDEESPEDAHLVGASGLVSWHSAHAVPGDYDATDEEADLASSSRDYAEAEAAEDEEGSDDDFGGAFGRDSSSQADRAWFAAQEHKTRTSRAASQKRQLGASLLAHGSAASSHRLVACESDWETDNSALGSGLATSHASAQVSDESTLDKLHSELLDVLECHLCYLLLHEPLTTPCGHTFCRSCLSRSLDHSSKCPLCRASMPPFSFFLDHPTNASILKLLNSTYAEPAAPGGDAAASLSLLPASLQGMRRLYTERKAGVEQEEREASLSTPVFVCTVGFPGMPTILHIFEPRYRLMIRRCVESGQPRFGMVLPSRDGSGGMAEYGTLLDIKSVQMLPDGRSMIETVGSKRFRLAESGALDGYIVGRIETIDDIGPEEEAALEKAAMERNKRRAAAAASASDDASPAPSSAAGGTSAAPLSRAPSQDSAAAAVPLIPAEDNYEARQLQSVGLPPLPSDQPEPSTRKMVEICESFITELRSGTAPWLVTRLNHTYGPMPPLDDISRLSFWMASVMPIDEHEKARLLPVRSPRIRLRIVVFWIEQLRSTWWFSSGCNVQ